MTLQLTTQTAMVLLTLLGRSAQYDLADIAIPEVNR